MEFYLHIKHYYRNSAGKIYFAICIYIRFHTWYRKFHYEKRKGKRAGPMCFVLFLCMCTLLWAPVTFWLLVNLQFINNIDRKRVSASSRSWICSHTQTHNHISTRIAVFFFSRSSCSIHSHDRFPMVSIIVVTLASSRHSHLVHFTSIARNII